MNLPVSVGVPLVKVGLVPVVELAVDGVNGTEVGVSLGVHLAAHLATFSSQKVADFTGERRDTSFTPAVVVVWQKSVLIIARRDGFTVLEK